jgi:hypothetical protein
MANAATALSPANLLSAVLISASVFTACLYVDSASAASARAACLRCQDSESADATKWVKNGTYRLEAVTLSLDDEVRGADPDSVRKMTRVKPAVLGADENDALVEETIRAMDIVGEAGDVAVLEAQWPNLTGRARYAYSLFITEDQLVDFYNVYVRVGRNKYVIVIGRDVESGEFQLRSGEGRLINRYGTEGKPRDLEQFKKVDAAAGR